MKYCPYCGASIHGSTISFCPECGSRLPTAADAPIGIPEPEENPKKKRRRKRLFERKKRKAKETPAVDDSYDGYYDDVLPPDVNRVNEGLDKGMILKIVALVAVVLLVAVLCIAMMYYL